MCGYVRGQAHWTVVGRGDVTICEHSIQVGKPSEYGDPYQNGHSIEDAIGSCLSVIELIVATALTYVTSTRRGAAWRQRHVR